ncbi:MAG: HAMP domain-containing histidine kinase [Clostridium sp.]|nr:HAMP domain-containing histidine kinase [Clostridium sp.]MCM1172287.1 HAMP domain-containing histidine kinase [Clostridium sp.]MCM1208806.1 HAMP domain-containing histidine kinase [Ruminococcus sp.]
MLLGAILFVWILYNNFIYAKFGNWFIYVLEHVFKFDYLTALNIYHNHVQIYAGTIISLTIAALFFIIFHFYLKSFTKYFEEIHRGIDALAKESEEDVVLLPELASTEKKINAIRHTLSTRKLDAQLANQRKDDLVMYLAHDLKTPLSSVIGYLTLLRDEPAISEETRKKYLSITLDKAERLEDLINEFFEITRFNLSNISLEYGKINLTRMLEQLVFEFNPMLADKNITCSLDAETDIMLSCDADKLQRVFDNILRNAVNYSYENSKITVSLKTETDHVSISFSNEGNTIPADKLERIFEQFYRLDTARNSSSGGTGLGLAIAKHIVELHKGTITATSADNITCFEVVLPLP